MIITLQHRNGNDTVVLKGAELLRTLALLLLAALALPAGADSNFDLDVGSPVTPAPENAGQLHTRLGVNIHFLKDDRALDLARGAGFSFVREDLTWSEVERHGRYDFGPFDDLMRSLETRGMGVLWILDYGHPDHGGKAPRSQEDIAAYARYAAAVVAHFRGHNARFEVWNEPNLKQFLPNPAVYPEILRAALDAIRREDPNAIVSTGGVSQFDFPFLEGMLRSGSARRASAIAVHPYRQSGPETVQADSMRLRGLIRRETGHDMPVWDTEWGYSSHGYFPKNFAGDGHSDAARTRQGVLAARELLTVWALGLPVAVWYDLRDDGPDPRNTEHNFGLLQQDNSDKPAMRAVRALTTVAREHTYAGLVRNCPRGVHAMRLDGAEEVVFVAWNDQPGATPALRVPRSEWISATDLFGAPLPGPDGASDKVAFSLAETAGPIYLHLKRR